MDEIIFYVNKVPRIGFLCGDSKRIDILCVSISKLGVRELLESCIYSCKRNYLREMIQITIQNGSAFVWNANDWLKLREDHRIVGNLTGCLVGLPRQETLQGLPLILLPEEVTLLLEKKVAKLMDDSSMSELPHKLTKERYINYKEENRKEQMACYEDQRRQQVTTMIDRIIEGKRRKLLGLNTKKRKINNEDSEVSEEKVPNVELDREEILRNELNKSAENLSPPVLVQTFTSEQWLNDPEAKDVSWKYPETVNDKLKYFVFKDLWEKGYFITDGHKFGVDYLVYPGDPVKFHAQFLVVCVECNSSIPPLDLISYARLGSTSRKTFVIASKLPNEDIFYSSIQWNEKS